MCSKLFKETEDFDTSEAKCGWEAGHLTSISSESENTYIFGLLNGVEGWLGGKYNESTGWTWLCEIVPSNGYVVIKMIAATADQAFTLYRYVYEKEL